MNKLLANLCGSLDADPVRDPKIYNVSEVDDTNLSVSSENNGPEFS